MKRLHSSFIVRPALFIWRHKLWTIAVLVALTVWLMSGGEEESPYVTEAVTRGMVEQVVDVTGRVIPSSEVKVAFDRAGRVAAVMVEVGSAVWPGRELAILDDAELQAEKRQAEADLTAQEAKLEQLKQGTRPEEVEIARGDLENAYLSVPDILGEAKRVVEDALYKQIDAIFIDDDTDPELSFTVGDTQIKNQAEFGRETVLLELKELRKEVESLTVVNRALLDERLQSVKEHLEKVEGFMAVVLQAVNAAIGVADTDIATYKAGVNTARDNILSSLAAITSQQKTISTAKNNLALKEAGSRAQDIQVQEALVEQARAGLERAISRLAGTIVTAPIYGTVTKKEIEVGGFVSAGQAAFTVSGSRLEIESFVPEADIAKVKVRDEAVVTLDAFGPEVKFVAVVTKIDPAETVIEGVSTYKVAYTFRDEAEMVKPGMTANVEILTARRENAVVMPQRALRRDDGRTFVLLPPEAEGGELREREVQIGIRGSNGLVEVISGLAVGEEVITFER